MSAENDACAGCDRGLCDGSRHRADNACRCGADGDGFGGCPDCLGAGEVYVISPAKTGGES